VIDKSGTWFSYKDERLGQGRDNARNFLLERPEISDIIKKEIYAKYGLIEELKEGEE